MCAGEGPMGDGQPGSLGGVCTARTETNTELTILFLPSLLLLANMKAFVIIPVPRAASAT